MSKYVPSVRIVAVLGILAALLIPFAVPTAKSQDVSASLVVTTVDGAGTPLAFSCVSVVDAAAVAPDGCDDDGDGAIVFGGLAEGQAVVYALDGSGASVAVDILPGSAASVTLVAGTPSSVEETFDPTASDVPVEVIFDDAETPTDLTQEAGTQEAGVESAEIAEASIPVEEAGSLPVTAGDDNYQVPMNGVLTESGPGVMFNDFGGVGALAVTVAVQPSNGVLSLNPNGGFTYTPSANYVGPDSFEYILEDSQLATDRAIVTITVFSTITPSPTSTAIPPAPVEVPCEINGNDPTNGTITILASVPLDFAYTFTDSFGTTQGPITGSLLANEFTSFVSFGPYSVTITFPRGNPQEFSGTCGSGVPTATATATSTPTEVPPTATNTATSTPTEVPPTATNTATATPTEVPPTATNTATATATETATNTATATATSTATATNTATATATATETATSTATATATSTATETATSTTTATSTSTATSTATATATATETATNTATATSTPTATATSTPTATPTQENIAGDFEIPVFALYCETDPGLLDGADIALGDLPDDCELGAGIGISADSSPAVALVTTYVTDATGSVSVAGFSGSDLTLTEDLDTLRPGYLPVVNPIVVPDLSPASDSPVFVNIPVPPADGSLVVTKRTCTNSGEQAPAFFVGAPGAGTPADGASCTLTSGVGFAVSGADGEFFRTTGADGSFSLDLPAGVYTVTEQSTGASADVTITSGQVTAVVVLNYDTLVTLPKTGSGPAGDSTMQLRLMILLATILAGAAVSLLRRQIRRDSTTA